LSGVNCRGQESRGRFRSQESIARMYLEPVIRTQESGAIGRKPGSG
jgi:hypothetical protein